ncbi:DUF2953 domain-containing protein [Paenibacillus lignilyticus]|uniref:DUF2953 domain-containing protein n=1 Tax=Paenibacillus lignilyticus TaxID=1172615 RepID=A0ABS5CEZ0_9BACL|nr:DUF2953 domain-containing protein [Paenibacillus lignilyticus]MBP3964420.1 DUF2953 domain-containing protein [Paenibacillus lignilyticus]
MLGYPLGWMIGTGLFFLLLIIALSSPVVIRGHMKRIGNDDDAELRIRALFGLIHYHWQLPIVKFKGMSIELKQEMLAENAGGIDLNAKMSSVDANSIMKSIDKAHLLLKHTDDMLGWVRITLGHVRLTEWYWRTAVGTGDAMWTAMLTGMVWSVKTTSIGVLSQLVRLTADPSLVVEPVYQKPHFSTEGKFTAKVPFGYAIFAILRLFVRIKKAHGLPGGFLGLQRILLRG